MNALYRNIYKLVDFVKGFNTAYHCNLKSLITNYAKREGLTKPPTAPEFLEIIGRVDDGILVADKMLRSLEVA